MNHSIYTSPIGEVLLTEEQGVITKIRTLDEPTIYDIIELSVAHPVVQTCADQLDEYFKGERKTFDFKYENKGTPFRTRVWQALETINYGQTITYGELAQQIGNKNASRAVGGANHHNNIWLVVPCHRVIGHKGQLTGYGGGLWRKEWLLAHEEKHR